MVFSSLRTALAAAALLSLATSQNIPTPTASVALNAMTYQGCFSSSDPLVDHGSYLYQTTGNCQPICVLLQMPVMALVNGSNCFCGPLLPAADTKVDKSECNTPCNGFDSQTCGGNNRWDVYLDGLNKNSIANYVPSSTSAPKTTKSGAAVVTVGGSTVVMTIGPTASSSSASGSPSKAGIAAGAVVGVVALAGIIGGVFLFLRQRRRKQAEEDYKRAAAINEFVGKPPATSHSSLTDTRLDPEIMMRRQSDGSIADNHDYSRRILQVRNPDGH